MSEWEGPCQRGHQNRQKYTPTNYSSHIHKYPSSTTHFHGESKTWKPFHQLLTPSFLYKTNYSLQVFIRKWGTSFDSPLPSPSSILHKSPKTEHLCFRRVSLTLRNTVYDKHTWAINTILLMFETRLLLSIYNIVSLCLAREKHWVVPWDAFGKKKNHYNSYQQPLS